MKRFIVGALAALVIAGSAGAQPVPYAWDAKVFTAVDAVSMQNSAVVITGIVQGETTPSTWAVATVTGISSDPMEWASACQRSALIAMGKPGQYLLEIKFGGPYSSNICTLSRVTP